MTTEKVTSNEEVDKGTKTLHDMKEAVLTIHGKDLDNFEGQSKGSRGWLDLDHEFLKIKFSTLERDFYEKTL